MNALALIFDCPILVACRRQISLAYQACPQTGKLYLLYHETGVSSNVKIVVDSVKTQSTVGDNQFDTAKAQGIYKVVKVTLTNNQNDAITVDTDSFTLVDSKGRKFSPSTDAQTALEASSDSKQSFFLQQINPGITVTGYIAFDVPKDATGLVMKAHGGMMGDEITLKLPQ